MMDFPVDLLPYRRCLYTVKDFLNLLNCVILLRPINNYNSCACQILDLAQPSAFAL